jgi:hypothetical protein
MVKKGVQIIVIGAQRRTIDVELMTQAVIALGRELAERTPQQKQTRTRKPEKTTTGAGARP